MSYRPSSIISTMRPRTEQGLAATPLLQLTLAPALSPAMGTHSDSSREVFLNEAEEGKCLLEFTYAI